MPSVVTITDPAGVEWILDGSGDVWEGRGRKGFHANSYTHFRDESPAVHGAFWRGVKVPPRELFVPIVVRNTDRDLLLAKRRALIKAISPLKGECTISVAWPDGSVRHIDCRYVDGMDAGEQGPGEYGITTMKYGLRFLADDPFLYGDLLTEEWDLAPSVRTELPIPGADTYYEVVSSPLLVGGVTITNNGDVDSYPTWIFTGPFTQIVAQNATTDQSFTITHTAASSANTLTLVTDPGNSSLIDEGGTNRWDKLVAGYQLWPLAQGDNDINITLTGATVDSGAIFSYRPRYESD